MEEELTEKQKKDREAATAKMEEMLEANDNKAWFGADFDTPIIKWKFEQAAVSSIFEDHRELWDFLVTACLNILSQALMVPSIGKRLSDALKEIERHIDEVVEEREEAPENKEQVYKTEKDVLKKINEALLKAREERENAEGKS